MKQIVVSIIFLFVAVMCTAQTTIPATVSWQVDNEAIQYHIFVCEGDAGSNPLVEDSSYAYISTLGLTEYSTTNLQVIFQTQVNGNYIQVAGFNENTAGLMAGATLSNLVLKPSEPNKMQMIILQL